MTDQQRRTLVAAVLGSSIVFLDGTVVNVALPHIGRELTSPRLGALEAESFVYNGYLLSLSALLVLAGALSDFYGRKRLFVIGLAGFGGLSVLCGLAPSMELLILFRVLQGVAGALLVPGSLALLTVAFQGEAQGRAFGIWAGASAVTTSLGPLLGGVLVDTISWRVAFLMNVPLVLLALWLAVRYVAESRIEGMQAVFDWPGALLIALAVGGLSFGAIYGQQRNWQDPIAWLVLAAGAAALALLPFELARSPQPLVPLELFRSRNFSVTNLSTLLIYGALYVTFYYLPLFTQGILGYTAAGAGLAGLPSSLLLAVGSSRFGTLSGRYGARWFMAVGPALVAIGVLWLSRIPVGSQPWALRLDDPSSYLPGVSYATDLLPAFLIFGTGMMLLVAPLTTALMTSIPPQNAGVGSAVNNAISRVGPQLAGALIFVAITTSFYSGLAGRVPGLDPASSALRQQVAPLNQPAPDTPAAVALAARFASRDAFGLAMWISAGLLLAGAAVNAVGIRNPSRTAGGMAEPLVSDTA